MAITLRFNHGGKNYYLTRAAARMTTTAILQEGDFVEVGDYCFVVTGFVHRLSDLSGDISPVTYCEVRPRVGPHQHEVPVLRDDDLLNLVMLGFKEG